MEGSGRGLGIAEGARRGSAGGTASESEGSGAWRILVVDDDTDVHVATEFALKGGSAFGRPFSFLHAYSGAEAVEILGTERDVAVVLLDAVMETDDAGPEAARRIREEIGQRTVRIILRTGHPGQVPELETVSRYDINDYKIKSELSRDKLLISLIAAVRSYEQLRRMEISLRGLESIIEASNRLIAEPGMRSFAEGVIAQVSGIAGIEPEGLVLAYGAGEGTGSRHVVVAASGRFSRLVGSCIDQIEDPAVAGNLASCFAGGQPVVGRRSVTLFFKDGSGRSFACWVGSERPLLDLDGRLFRVLGANIGLCAGNVDLVERLRRRAYEDALVGLPSLSAFVEEIDRRMGAARCGDQALALVDIAQFGALNDALGHAYGDRLLKAFARRLERGMPSGCALARTGADVFGVLGDSSVVNGENLLRLFSEPLDVGGAAQGVSVSVGLANLEGGDDGAACLKNAHIALKRAKAEGPGHAVWYSDSIGAEARERVRLLRGLRVDFSRRRLFTAYQPQVDLSDGRVVGFEALMRWTTADGRAVPPDLFIPVAEHSGLIRPLGAWVLRRALDDLAALRSACRGGLRMAVNVSASQLKDPGFLELLGRALEGRGLSDGEVEIEFTESVSMFGLEGAARMLDGIKAMGVTVAIDDFGTGFSSLSSIDSWPVDRIKIDRSFVAGLAEPRGGSRIVDLIVPLGARLGVKVLAEGVESAAQEARLRELGCSEAQGYLYGRPMKIADAREWLRDRA